MLKVNLGSGRIVIPDYLNVDITKHYGSGNECLTSYVLDIEKEVLPFADESVEEIIANNIFEHLGDGFIFCLNECHRVMAKDGLLKGCVPVAGSKKDFMDITHKRHFNKISFDYMCSNDDHPDKCYHPRYADYGVKPWRKIEVKTEDDIIYFTLKKL